MVAAIRQHTPNDRSRRDRSKAEGAIHFCGVDIALSSLDVPIRVSHDDYLTSHEYDLEAMYETVVKEGHKRCPW